MTSSGLSVETHQRATKNLHDAGPYIAQPVGAKLADNFMADTIESTLGVEDQMLECNSHRGAAEAPAITVVLRS